MGMFNSILQKLGLGHMAAPAPAAAPPPPPGDQGPRTATSQMPIQGEAQAMAAAPVREVDVVAKLKKLAADNPQTLNWTGSIIDLMKLFGLASDHAARVRLAEELAYPHDLPQATDQDAVTKVNIWLHQTVIQKLADIAGKRSADLLG